VDVDEGEKAVTLTAELPGVTEKDIDVSLVGDQLTIKGEKRSEHEEKKEMEAMWFIARSARNGAFQRTITVPYKVDPNQVSADVKDGVLRITLPKPPDAIAQRKVKKSKSTKSSRGFGGGGPTPA